MTSHRQLVNGCFVNFDRRDEFNHRFGGSHSSAGAWCPNCDKPLMLYLRLNLQDPLLSFRRALPNLRWLDLFYCMRCALAWRDFSYRVLNEQSIAVVEVHRGCVSWDEWLEACGGRDEFNERLIALTPIPHRLQELWDRLNELRHGEELNVTEFADVKSLTRGYAFPGAAGFSPSYYFVNQVGGRSLLCQGIDDPDCPTCGEEQSGRRKMYFLASLYHDSRSRLCIAYPCTQITFFLCPLCLTVKAVHRTT